LLALLGLAGKVMEMEYWFWPVLRLLAGLITVLGNGRIRVVLAENLILKQQLLAMRRSRRRSPNLRTADRVLFGFCAQVLSPRRLLCAAIILKPGTLLRFHRGFKDCKNRFLHSLSPRQKPGPKGPSPELIRAICELKQRNPRFGCPKIAQHLAKTFGIDIDKDVVRRVLAAHYRPERRENEPSWLTLLGQTKDSLWSLDLFRTESILLRSYWVLVVMDQFTRQIIGFGVQAAAVDGPALCRMFNRAISGRRCLRGSVLIMIRYSSSTAGRPICGSWACKRCKRCPRFPGHIHLSNGSLRPSAGSIWIVYSFGPQLTWNESWGCSETTITRLACTKGYPATRPERKRAAHPLRQPALRITVGKVIAAGCLNRQSPLEWLFAMYRVR
jgi:transposase InsO family protein